MELWSYLVKFVLGGTLVCGFALLSEVAQPKRFAGLFAAAPSVLLAGLVVTLLSQSVSHAILTAQGATAGAVGLVTYCLVVTPAIRRFKALLGSVLSLLLWFGGALGAYLLLGKVVGW